MKTAVATDDGSGCVHGIAWTDSCGECGRGPMLVAGQLVTQSTGMAAFDATRGSVTLTVVPLVQTAATCRHGLSLHVPCQLCWFAP